MPIVGEIAAKSPAEVVYEEPWGTGITLKKLGENYKRKVSMLVPLNSYYEPNVYEKGDPDIVMIGILDLCIRMYNR